MNVDERVTSTSVLIQLVGTLSKVDDDGGENVGKKNEFAFFQT